MFTGRRRVPADEQIRFGRLLQESDLPRLAIPAVAGIDLAAWAAQNRGRLRCELDTFGAVLFRGFAIDTAQRLQAVSERMCRSLSGYVERRSPRISLGGEVLTSTTFPSDQYIHFHNEKSFACEWPMQLHFCCIRPADEGGWTPLADSRRVFSHLSESTRAIFLERGVRYVRNFHPHVGLSWRETFQTEDRADVERICRKSGISFAWLDGERLRTWQDRHAAAVHPRTGETVWFNQAHYFHLHALPARTAEAMRRDYDEQDLPQHAFFGDGTAIGEETIDEIHACYEAEQVSFPWERGDLLVLDNMLVAHSRTPYRGPRLIALTLGDLHTPALSRGGLAGAM